jgi:hypothetical protein
MGKHVFMAFHGGGTIESILDGGLLGVFSTERAAKERVRYLLSFYKADREFHIIKVEVHEVKSYKTERKTIKGKRTLVIKQQKNIKR